MLGMLQRASASRLLKDCEFSIDNVSTSLQMRSLQAYALDPFDSALESIRSHQLSRCTSFFNKKSL